jgi:outer membrane lipopolysaccharide assembly protein LptE/RlpB
MLMLLLPDDLLLLMLSLAACTHHLKRDTHTPTDDTHTAHRGYSFLSLSVSPPTYVYLGRPKYGLTLGGPG